ncbi:hypothetical protein EDB84DRAFT_1569630 [Lactarius hengduanensis]|nr:hypothetical protein EDB84DRAFT_1569630 [Lactarius hengduanensis]
MGPAARPSATISQGFSLPSPLLHHALEAGALAASELPGSAPFKPQKGSMQSQMEAKLARMNLKSPGLKSTISGFPLRPHPAPALRTASRLPSTPLHLPHLRNPPMPSATQATPPPTLAQQRAKLKASGNVARRISAPELAASRERGTGAGVLGPGAERDNFSTQEISVEP